MHHEAPFVLLFAVAMAVALSTRRLRIPYTVALVLTGLALGATRLVVGVHLTKELLFAVFLPGLVFEAAYHLKFSELRENARSIFGLAVPGVAAACAATASILAVGPLAAGAGLTWRDALLFSTLISATDPIAVVALFKTLGAPRRLGVIVEGESLVNDGTAVVLFTIVAAALASGRADVLAGAAEFARVVGAGALVGGAIGLVGARVMRRADTPVAGEEPGTSRAATVIAFTVVTAYGSFVAAEELGVSGIIATVTAGVICGSYAAPRSMSPATRVSVESFWEFAAYALNSLVFLLIGLEVRVGDLLASWRPILAAYAAVTLGRAVVVVVASALLRPTRERIPLRFAAVLAWGGLRGALSMVLALALPDAWAGRGRIVTITFGVVLLSIVVQGTTSGPLLRRLGLTRTAGEA